MANNSNNNTIYQITQLLLGLSAPWTRGTPRELRIPSEYVVLEAVEPSIFFPLLPNALNKRAIH